MGAKLTVTEVRPPGRVLPNVSARAVLTLELSRDDSAKDNISYEQSIFKSDGDCGSDPNPSWHHGLCTGT